MKLNQSMPSLSGATAILNGDVTTDMLVGKPTFIHFWSVSCQLCKKAMPTIHEFRDEYKEKLNVVSIHMPRCEEDRDMDRIRSTMEQYDIKQVTCIDNEHILKELFNNQYVPAYYLFDKEGKLRHYQAGGSSLAMVKRRLTRLLQETVREV